MSKQPTEFTFEIKNLVAQTILDKGLNINLDRIVVQEIELAEKFKLIRAILDIATQEDELMKVPANWFEALKEELLKKSKILKFLLKGMTVKYNTIWSVHKYPELVGYPPGREYVHLKIVSYKDLVNNEK